MVMTQIPIIEFVIGRNADGTPIVESFPTTIDAEADTTVVARITTLDKHGEPTRSIGVPARGRADAFSPEGEPK